MQLVINVAAMLMAFIALIALLNGLLGLIGSWFDIKLSLDLIFGYLLSPFAILIGVSPGEAVQAASFIGQNLQSTNRCIRKLRTAHGRVL